MAQGKERADELVFAQGLAESREMAKRLIMAGKVALEDVSGVRQKVDKPGHKYPPDTAFVLVGIEKYVSRGAYKLLTAIEHFKLDVAGFVCLDAGASTGGFTDCLLQHGAAKVYAVDVGKEQLHERMRRDPRVISMEGTNLRTAPESLIPEPVDIIVADVSFISLTLILPPCVRWLKEGGLVAALGVDRGEDVRDVLRAEPPERVRTEEGDGIHAVKVFSRFKDTKKFADRLYKIGVPDSEIGCPEGERMPAGPADDIVGCERRYFFQKLLCYPKLFLSLHPISPVNQWRSGAVL